jgi:hypothetical protein
MGRDCFELKTPAAAHFAGYKRDPNRELPLSQYLISHTVVVNEFVPSNPRLNVLNILQKIKKKARKKKEDHGSEGKVPNHRYIPLSKSYFHTK